MGIRQTKNMALQTYSDGMVERMNMTESISIQSSKTPRIVIKTADLLGRTVIRMLVGENSELFTSTEWLRMLEVTVKHQYGNLYRQPLVELDTQ